MNDDYEKALAEAKAAMADEEKRKLEREKMRPTSIAWGRGDSLQVAAEKAAVAALKKLKLRYYALDDDPVARAQFAALAIACQQRKKNLLEVLEQLANLPDAVPGLKQKTPAPGEGEIPPLATDPITGLRVRNPWLPIPGKTGAKAFDHKSQIFIREVSPDLAEWLQACAENGGAPSYAMLDALAAKKQHLDRLREIQYDETDWASNKLRANSGASETERELFARSIQDPDLLQFHRDEAGTGAPKLKFGNLTTRMAVAGYDRELVETYKTAEGVFAEWQKAQPQPQEKPVVLLDQRGRPRKAA